MKNTKTQDGLEAIMRVKGKKSLAEIWDEDVQLSADRVRELNQVYETNQE